MKLIAYLVVCVCLCLGAIAATTAYVPTLEIAEQAVKDGEKLTLAAAAGAVGERHPKTPLAKAGTELDLAVIAKLREAEVSRVRVKEFAFGRWTHAWLFFLSVLGLAVFGLVAKREIRREVRARMADPDAQKNSPEKAIRAIAASVDELVAEVEQGLSAAPGAGDAYASVDTARIVEQLGELQQTHMEAVVDGRATLIESLGLSGYAELMDRYSVLERQINRAWSAAADGVPEEAVICLRRASELSGAALEKVAG